MNQLYESTEAELIGKMADHCKLLGDKSRLTMLAALQVQDLCVCDLVELVGLSQPGVSQHLRKLKEAGIVTESRKGTWIYYTLNLDDKPHLRVLLAHVPSMRDKVRELKNNC